MLRRLASDHVSITEVAEYYAEALAQGYDNTVAYRRAGGIPESQVVDLYFTDFVRDPVGTVRRAYAHFGLELPEAAARAMQDFLDANPADKHGRHEYRLADTGLDEGALRERFADYQRWFDVPSETV